MRIALDCSSAARPEATGVAMYIRRLVRAFARTQTDARFTLVHRLSRWKHRANFVPPPASNFRSKLMLEPLHPFFGREVDVFHGLDARIPGTWMKGRMVATIHDVFSALQSQEFATSEFRELKNRRYRELIERADRIVVVSESSRKDVLETLRPDPARVRVIHEAGGEEFFPRKDEEIQSVRQRHGLDRPYLIYVGSLNKRKNIPAMIRAFARAREEARSDALFAIAGRLGFGAEDIPKAIEASGAKDAIRLLGYLPDKDIPALYSGAWGLLFATCYEGFGIPVVEAFACGCPVIGGTAGSVPEIAGGHALLVDPRDEDAIAAHIKCLLGDESLRSKLRIGGLARAKDFSWDRAARECLEVYRELQGGS